MRGVAVMPTYRLRRDRELRAAATAGERALRSCVLCPRHCRVDRRRGQLGFCRAAANAAVAHWQVHYGEEPPLAEAGGAGAIFFAQCTMTCVFCQNYQISQQGENARSLSARQLADVMLALQQQGSQNIDLVSPTQYVPQILAAVRIARRDGLRLPLVYNTNGYESVTTLRLLEPWIDIYLPDFKYGDDRLARRYSGVSDYVSHARQSLEEMLRQTGSLQLDGRGRAVRGVIVRHLVLPHDQAATGAVLDVLARLGPEQMGLSLMSQYAPCYRAGEYAQMNRRVDQHEYAAAVARAREIEFMQCWIQEQDSNTVYFPDFHRAAVFLPERTVKEKL